MFGFLIGTACLIGLIVTIARGRRAHGAWGGGCGWAGGASWREGRGSGDGHDEGSHHRRSGLRWFLRGLFERLDTTPGQEKVILAAVDEVRQVGEAARGELKKTRSDVAKATRSASFDETLMGEAFARHDAEIEAMRKAIVGAMAKIHAVLDDKQRETLAAMLESGPSFFGGRGGPYRRYAL